MNKREILERCENAGICKHSRDGYGGYVLTCSIEDAVKKFCKIFPEKFTAEIYLFMDLFSPMSGSWIRYGDLLKQEFSKRRKKSIFISPGVDRIKAERLRLVEKQGVDLKMLAKSKRGKMSGMAVWYILPERLRNGILSLMPNGRKIRADINRVMHGKDELKKLEIAGALIAAEIDRIVYLREKNKR